jgi:selenocysteine lyase/cysteine desulfurase
MTRSARLEPTLPNRRSIAAIRDRLEPELDAAARSLGFRPDLQLDWPAELTVSGPVALAVAVDLLDGIGFEAIEAHDRALSAHGLARLQSVPGLRILGTAGPVDRVPVFTFTLAGATVPEIVAAADAAGIAVRGGDMAALPLLKRFGVTAAARASAYLYNTTDEIDRLEAVLRALNRASPAAK